MKAKSPFMYRLFIATYFLVVLACGFQNARAYYDPTAGHFLSADPLGHAASMDLHSFCNGDPINRFDPTGRFGKGAVAAIGDMMDFSGLPSYRKFMGPVANGTAFDLGYTTAKTVKMVSEAVALQGFISLAAEGLGAGVALRAEGESAMLAETEAAGFAEARAAMSAESSFVGDVGLMESRAVSSEANLAGSAGNSQSYLPYRQGVNYNLNTVNESLGATRSSEAGTETFYRSMSKKEYANFLQNGGLEVRLKGSSELFVTQDANYLKGLGSRPSQAGKYDVIVQFELKSGTKQGLIDIGATHPSAANIEAYSELPSFNSGMNAVQLKLEKGLVPSYGLGSSQKGLQLFNSSIQQFKIISP